MRSKSKSRSRGRGLEAGLDHVRVSDGRVGDVSCGERGTVGGMVVPVSGGLLQGHCKRAARYTGIEGLIRLIRKRL